MSLDKSRKESQMKAGRYLLYGVIRGFGPAFGVVLGVACGLAVLASIERANSKKEDKA